jgi:hypothetical protein
MVVVGWHRACKRRRS